MKIYREHISKLSLFRTKICGSTVI